MKPTRLLLGTSLLLVFAALLSGIVKAHSQTTAQATPGASGGIPEQAPPSWRQKDWSVLRAQCNELLSKVAARQQMTAEQLKTVRPFTEQEHEEIVSCLSMLPRPAEPPRPTSPPPSE